MNQFFCAWPAFPISEEIHYCTQAKASSRRMGSSDVSAIGTTVSGIFEAHVIAIFYSSTLRRSWQSRLVPPEAKMSFGRSPVSAFANGNMIICWCSQSNNERLMSTYYLSADLKPCTFGDTSTVHACQVRSSRERFGSHRLTSSATTAVPTQIPTVIPLNFLPPDLRRD